MFKDEEVRKATLEYFNGDELATNVFMTKYCMRNKKGEFVESNPRHMHKRMALEFTRIEEKFGGDNKLEYDQIYNLFDDFKWIVPQGSPMMGIGNDYINVSLSNCVVVASPKDDMSSIIESGKELANLFKRRCGVGIDISNLRPENSPVNNSARTTTGAWSFADFYSYVCRMVGQNGRRGALMISIDIRHPDVEKFITMKNDLTKVTGANVSVKITDDFMEAVRDDQDYTLHFPVGSDNPRYTKSVKAREVWNSIVNSATKTAEPGLLMWDNIKNNLPAEAYESWGFGTVCTNPCGEIPLSEYDSCRLISINLKNFVKSPFGKRAKFDFEHFSKVVASGMRLSDDLVELEIEKLQNIVQVTDSDDEEFMWEKLSIACETGRRTGLGTHGLADAIACLGLAYDSDKSVKIIEKIYETFKIAAYTESVNLAKERGAFEIHDWDVEKDNEFIKRLPEELQEQIKKHGRRNISILTNAPTGSVSIMSQTSSGLEPVFRNYYMRRRKLSHNEQDAECDFIDDLGDKWVEYKVFHHNVQQYLKKYKVDKIPDFFVESDQIDWQKRVAIQAAIQQHIDHSISSTINLPKDTPPEVVGELYLKGWEEGLKGITVYVEGSRSGVLVAAKEEQEAPTGDFPQHAAPKRPIELPCKIHHATIQGEKWIILVGILDGKPYETMGGKANLVEISKKYTEGILVKHPRKSVNSRYDLKVGTNGDEIIIKDLVKVFDNANHSAFTRMISLGLRHGANIQYVVEQLQKDRDSDMFSFAKCVSRVLKSYIIDGTVPTEDACPQCNAENALIYVEGCVTCKQCGFSKCG
tara:strand:+ start:2241 stop:4673 length:2433 start_codon:yes stop_codon:yes gene_type:complete